MKERILERIRAAWAAFEARAALMRLSDRAITLAAVALLPPVLIFAFLMPWHDGSLKRARAQLSVLSAREAALSRDEAEAGRFAREAADRAEEAALFDRLVVPSDAAIRLLNELTTRAEKAGLDIRFAKKNARFDRAAERTFLPPAAEGVAPDPAQAVRYKVLPIEIACTAPTADALAFLHILEGFRNLNVGVRSLALGSEGARLSMTLELEMVIELKMPEGENG